MIKVIAYPADVLNAPRADLFIDFPSSKIHHIIDQPN
jgi:hypothetical protein